MMLSRTFEKRLARAERIAKTKGRFASDCICFPLDEQPCFAFPVEEKIAAELKCPLHGDRFAQFVHIYVARWRREKEMQRWLQRSKQFRKAWLASFPSELWPAQDELVDGKLVLRLKDGTIVPS